MKIIVGIGLAAILTAAPALAQVPDVKVPPVKRQAPVERYGLVGGKDPVTVELAAAKIGITGKMNRGANCVLHPNDRVIFVTEVAGADPARVEVKRRVLGVRLAMPNLQTCPAGSHLYTSKLAFEAWEKAYVAAEAEKTMKKGPSGKVVDKK